MYLTVTCSHRDFFSYWYGTGTLISAVVDEDLSVGRFVVDYGDDTYRAQYQADRFASGLIFATLTEKDNT